MKKIKTLFKKDPTNLGRAIPEIQIEFFHTTPFTMTRKYDGTSTAIIDQKLYKRFDLKKGRTLPDGAIPCQEADSVTGHHPHWVPCVRDNKQDKYHWEAFDRLVAINKSVKLLIEDGTYELCGPKVQGNPEKFDEHVLVKHGADEIRTAWFVGYMQESMNTASDLELFEAFEEYLSQVDIEGIVFHFENGEMCKLRKSDFGIKR